MLDTNSRNRKLFQLALAQKEHHGSTMSWYLKLEPAQLGQELYHLALEAADKKSLMDFEILCVFFSPEACEWLLKLPNLYWFWRVVADATMFADDEGMIQLRQVHQAMAELRCSASRAYNLRATVDSLTAPEVVARTAAGIILSSGGLVRDLKIITNIIFTFDY